MNWLSIVVNLVIIICGFIAVHHWRRAMVSFWQGTGLRIDIHTWVNLGVGVIIGFLVMVGIFAVEWGSGVLQVNGVHAPDTGFLGWLLILIIAAFWEEFIFRSLMLNGLQVIVRKRWLAVIIMAIFFGLAHAGNPNASALSVFGNSVGSLMYAVAFLGSGRIWMPIGLHFAWNFFQGPVLGFPVSGIDMGGLVQQTSVGSDLIAGGGYGPEAGLVGMAFRFVAIGLLIGWLAWRSGGDRTQPIGLRDR